MAECKGCAGKADIVLPLQEVLTLRVRGMDGEKRVQALGQEMEAGLCHACLDQYIGRLAEPKEEIRKATLMYGGIALAGLAMFFIPASAMGFDLRFPGAGAFVIGALGFIRRYQAIQERKKAIVSADAEENRNVYMLEYLHTLLPKKEGENDLSYVPLRDREAAMNIGTLAAAYGLLPGIAQQLSLRLRPRDVEIDMEETKRK